MKNKQIKLDGVIIPYVINNDGIEFEFQTTTEAANWLIENKYTKMTNPKIVRQEICDRIRKNKKYLGLFVEYIGE